MIGSAPSHLTVGYGALDVLMPMHVIVGSDWLIRHAGPTLVRMLPEAGPVGRDFRDVFAVRRPRDFERQQATRPESQTKLHLQLRDGRETALKGIVTQLPDGGFLVNLSFGIGVVDAVRDYALTGRDFAATDLTIEMLYLVEAKSAAMEASRDLNLRLQRAKRRAEEQAQTDVLTGTRNRRALDAELERLIATPAPFALMRLDLDFFKAVNDTMGHAAGDHVLQVVARILIEETRAGDTVARVGGDEFVLVLNGVTDSERIGAVAARIIERIARPIPFDGHMCCVNTSIGSTMSTFYDRPDTDRMHRDADTALYESKRLGRSRHTCASSLIDGLRPDAPATDRRATA